MFARSMTSQIRHCKLKGILGIVAFKNTFKVYGLACFKLKYDAIELPNCR